MASFISCRTLTSGLNSCMKFASLIFLLCKFLSNESTSIFVLADKPPWTFRIWSDQGLSRSTCFMSARCCLYFWTSGCLLSPIKNDEQPKHLIWYTTPFDSQIPFLSTQIVQFCFLQLLSYKLVPTSNFLREEDGTAGTLAYISRFLKTCRTPAVK